MCFFGVFVVVVLLFLVLLSKTRDMKALWKERKERKINREKETRYRKKEYETEIIQTTTECEPRDTRSL